MSHPKTQRLDDDQADILIRIFDEDGFVGLSPYQDWVIAALHEWSEIRDREMFTDSPDDSVSSCQRCGDDIPAGREICGALECGGHPLP